MPWQALLGASAAAIFLAALAWVQHETLLGGPSNEFRTIYWSAQGRDMGKLATHAALHPPAWKLLTAPLAALAYPAAALLWTILSLWAAACFVGFWRPSAPSTNLLALALSVPLFFALWHGLETPFLLAAAAMSAWAVRRGRDFVAGLFLGLGLLAPQLFAMIPIMALAQRRRRLGLGLAASCGGILALSFLAGPADWPALWLEAVMQRMDAAQAGGEPTLWSLTRLGGADAGVALAACMAAAAAVSVIAFRVSYPFALGAALAAGLLASPFATATDALLLLPGALAALALARSWALRASAIVLLLPPLFVLGAPVTPLAVIAATTTFLLLALAESLAGPVQEPPSPGTAPPPAASPQSASA